MTRRIGRSPLLARLPLIGSAAACALLAGCGGGGPREAAGTAPAVTEARGHADSAEDRVRHGDLQGALAEFSRAIAENPNFVRARAGMGDIYRIQSDWARAALQYEAAATLQPDNAMLHYYIGLMLHLQNRVSEAVSAYLYAYRIAPNHFETNLNLANAYYQLDDLEQARAHAQRAVALRPDDGNARFTLGEIYATQGLHEEAVTEFQQAAELLEITPRLLTSWAESLLALERYAEAKNVLERLAREAPGPWAQERLGFAEFKLNNLDEAQAAFEAALALDPTYVPAINGVGVVELNRYVASDKQDREAHARAIKRLQESLQLDPEQQQIKELLFRYQR